MMDPSLALRTCETVLREPVTLAYAQTSGAGWVTQGAAEAKQQNWQERAGIEQKYRATKGVAAVPATGLVDANFYDLVAIADRHWEPLPPARGNRAKVCRSCGGWAIRRTPSATAARGISFPNCWRCAFDALVA